MTVVPASIPEGAPASFYVVSGTLPLDSQSYVPRQADHDLLAALMAGQYCFVLNSRQMGKSSLSVRTMARLQQAGITTVFLDLQKFGGSNTTPDQWYLGLLSETGRALGLRKEFLAYAKDNASYSLVQRFLGALHDVALANTDRRIVVFVDEIDAIRSLPFATDEFFAALRECYNRRVQEPEYGRLVFVLVGSATASDLIQDTRTSPFNIGKRIELKDFTELEALPLAAGIARANAGALVRRVYYWTHGHPFLTQALCAEIATDAKILTTSDVDGLVGQMFFEAKARERNVNLADVSNRILSSYLEAGQKEEHRAAMLDLYRQVWRGRKRVIDDETNRLIAVLKLSGITTSVNGVLRVRNRIYERVFDRAWIEQSMPDAELRRQKQAYKAGMLRTTLVAGVIVLLTTGLSAWAVHSARVARSETSRANDNARLADLKTREAQESALAQQRSAESAKRSAEAARRSAAEKAAALTIAQAAEHKARVAKIEADAQARKAVEAARSEKRQRQIADAANSKEARATLTAKREAEHSRHLLYEATMGQVQSEWDNNNAPKVRELLSQIQNHPDRGIEWDYWNHRCRIEERLTLLVLNGHQDEVWGVAVSPDGKWIASGSIDRTVRIWNARTGDCQRILTGFPDKVIHVTFSPDSRRLATLCSTGEVRVYDVNTANAQLRMSQPTVYPTSVVFSPDGNVVAATNGPYVRLWNAQSGALLRTLEDAAWILQIAFTPDSRCIVTTGMGHTVSLWNALTGKRIREVSGHAGPVAALAISPDGKRFVTGSRPGELIVWDATTYQKIQAFQAHKAEITSAVFSRDGTRFATGSSDFSARLWDVQTGTLLREIKGHSGAVRSIAFLPDGNSLVTASEDHSVKVHSLANNDVPMLPANIQFRDCLLFSSYDGSHLVTNEPDIGRLKIQNWNTHSLQPMSVLSSFLPPIYSPDGKRVALIERDKIGVWDVQGSKRRFILQGLAPLSVVFAADSRSLLIAERSRTIRLYDVQSGQERKSTRILAHKETLLAVSPDARYCLLTEKSGDKADPFFEYGNELLVREISTGKVRCRLVGHTGYITDAVYTPDGRRIITASRDRTAKIWNALTGHELATLKGHTSDLKSIAISGDGKQIATSDVGHRVRLWNAAPLTEGQLLPDDLKRDQAELQRMQHLSQDLTQWELTSETPERYSHLGRLAAEAGQWEKARNSFANAVRLGRVNGRDIRYVNRADYDSLAMMQVTLGDLAGYRHTCEEMAALADLDLRFSATAFYANTWTLGPQGFRDYSSVLKRQREVVRTFPNNLMFQTMFGDLTYRAGQWQECLSLLTPFLTGDRAGEAEAAGIDLDEWAYVAMAHWQLGHRDEARRYLRGGEEWLVKRKSGLSWDEILKCEYRLKEARAMIAPSETEPSK